MRCCHTYGLVMLPLSEWTWRPSVHSTGMEVATGVSLIVTRSRVRTYQGLLQRTLDARNVESSCNRDSLASLNLELWHMWRCYPDSKEMSRASAGTSRLVQARGGKRVDESSYGGRPVSHNKFEPLVTTF